MSEPKSPSAMERIKDIEEWVSFNKPDSADTVWDRRTYRKFKFLFRAFCVMRGLYINHIIKYGTDTYSAQLVGDTEFEEAMKRGEATPSESSPEPERPPEPSPESEGPRTPH